MKDYSWKLLIIKLFIIASAYSVVYLEIRTYTNLVTSIGEMIFNTDYKNVLIYSFVCLSIPSLIILFGKTKMSFYISLVFLMLILLIFYPSINLEGQDVVF